MEIIKYKKLLTKVENNDRIIPIKKIGVIGDVKLYLNAYIKKSMLPPNL